MQRIDEMLRAMVSRAADATLSAQTTEDDPPMLRDVVKMVEAELRTAEVRGIIKFHVAKRCYVDYLSVATGLGMFSGGSQLAECLGRIMDEDIEQKRPLSCAAVVSKKSGLPGRGFFEHARKRGLPVGQTPDDERRFWEDQVRELGLYPPGDGEIARNLRPSFARKLWLANKSAALLVGPPQMDANELAAALVKNPKTPGRVVHERESLDDVAVVFLDDGKVIAVAEEHGPVATVIGLLNNATGVFQLIPKVTA